MILSRLKYYIIVSFCQNHSSNGAQARDMYQWSKKLRLSISDFDMNKAEILTNTLHNCLQNHSSQNCARNCSRNCLHNSLFTCHTGATNIFLNDLGMKFSMKVSTKLSTPCWHSWNNYLIEKKRKIYIQLTFLN